MNDIRPQDDPKLILHAAASGLEAQASTYGTDDEGQQAAADYFNALPEAARTLLLTLAVDAGAKQVDQVTLSSAQGRAKFDERDRHIKVQFERIDAAYRRATMALTTFDVPPVPLGESIPEPYIELPKDA